MRIPELMNAIRNIAVREGYVPQTFKLQLEKLQAHGRLYEIGEYENDRRAEYGLPPIHEEAAEIRQILDRANMMPTEAVGPNKED